MLAVELTRRLSSSLIFTFCGLRQLLPGVARLRPMTVKGIGLPVAPWLHGSLDTATTLSGCGSSSETWVSPGALSASLVQNVQGEKLLSPLR